MRDYHDHEWGVPSHDDRDLFEMLILEGAQAGLSWATILNRREDPGIIRNRLKIYGTRTNAKAFLRGQAEFGSFATYLWNWVGGVPVASTTREHLRTCTPRPSCPTASAKT
jgi:DNA-3-methyladenine glycosylase I